MTMRRFLLGGRTIRPILAMSMLIAAHSAALAQTLSAGTYSTEKGWGTLTVARAGGKTTFSIEAIGANAHSCSLEGEIKDGRATLEGDDGKPCIVSFAARDGGVEVGGNEACRYWCGARAQFDAVYYPLPKGCSGDDRTAARDRFKKLYDKRQYAEAQATLAPLLSGCGRFLDWREDGWVRNDLGLTQHKLGDDAGCRQTLAPLTADAAKSDAAISEQWPPSDADDWLPIVRAARTNLKLCGTVARP